MRIPTLSVLTLLLAAALMLLGCTSGTRPTGSDTGEAGATPPGPGYFEDVTVKIVTIETGSGHTNAVLSGQAFAFIGGPEHNAFAKAKGAELRSIINCVDRGNNYFCAAPGFEPKNTDWASYFKGKTIAVGPLGGTPNSILRYLLGKWKLDARRDVTLIEIGRAHV